MAELQGLYVIIDPAACRGRPPAQVARAALDGGAALIQWRDKERDKGLQLADSAEIFESCVRRGIPFIVNDHADLALVLANSARRIPGAGSASRTRALALLGVHVGQKDLPLIEVRRILPSGCIVGASTNDPAEAKLADADGAAYIAVGDLFGTGSKQGTRTASPERLAQVRKATKKPLFGIGGINATNVREVMEAGADGVAVISAVCSADDPRAASEELAGLVERFRRGR